MPLLNTSAALTIIFSRPAPLLRVPAFSFVHPDTVRHVAAVRPDAKRLYALSRGASFSLGAITNQVSAEAFGGQLERIVPRLFRYRFDPSAKTRAAMEQLWRAVVGGGGNGGGDFSTREKEVSHVADRARGDGWWFRIEAVRI